MLKKEKEEEEDCIISQTFIFIKFAEILNNFIISMILLLGCLHVWILHWREQKIHFKQILRGNANDNRKSMAH